MITRGLVLVRVMSFIITLLCNMAIAQGAYTHILLSESGQKPVIQVDQNENIQIIHWDYGLYHSIYDSNGIELEAPQMISQFITQYSDMAIGNNIGLAVGEAWDEGNIWSTPIKGRKFAVAGDLIGDEFYLNYPYYDMYHRYDASITHTQNDSFFVVWNADVGTGEIYGQIISDSTIVYNNFLVNDHPTGDVTFPHPKVIGIEGCYQIVVVWIDDRSSIPLLYGRTLTTNGVPLDSSYLISEMPNVLAVTNSSLIMNDCGELVVSYIAMLDDSISYVFQKAFMSDGQAITNSEIISQYPARELIDMAQQDDGKYIVEWEATYNGHSRIAAQRFDGDGSLIGDNFWITVAVDSIHQLAPRVVLYNNTIYSAWYEQDYEYNRSAWLNIIDFNNPPVSTYEEPGILAGFSLRQNFPNPFNPVTTIQYELSRRSDVQISIYDLLGKEVTTLVSETQEAGFKSVQWDASNVASGVYLYQIKASGFVQTKKMVFLK